MNHIKKKSYVQAYFQIKTNGRYEHSFQERMKVIGLNFAIAGFGLLSIYGGGRRCLSAKSEEWK
jgi:hypothetical protein